MTSIAIVGAGSSGIFASILLAKRGLKVTVLEKNDRPGKKLLATGNGRCNLTNKNLSIDNYHGQNPRFVESALAKLSSEDLIDIFESMGLLTTELTRGRVYPRSLKSSSVLDLLMLNARKAGVNFVFGQDIKTIVKEGNSFSLTSKEWKNYNFDMVVLATGGMTLKNSGSDGSGYKLAESLGHKIEALSVGIVQLVLQSGEYKKLKGHRFFANAKLYEEKKMIGEENDEILFTDYGISGPAILKLSHLAIDSLDKGKKTYIKIDMFPDFTDKDLLNFLSKRFSQREDYTIYEALLGMVDSDLLEKIIARVLDPKLPVKSLDYGDVVKLRDLLKNWDFEVKGHHMVDGAQVTRGGVSTREINPKTMESKLVEGLYFIGEIIDVDGDCGGYNLHWAWASSSSLASNIFNKKR